MLTDLGQKFHFPAKITLTNLRLEHVVWSSCLLFMYVTEHTEPWGNSVDESKMLEYAELAVITELNNVAGELGSVQKRKTVEDLQPCQQLSY